MVLSRREQIIGLATAAVIGFLAIDRIALTPLLDQRDRVAADTLKAQSDVQNAKRLLNNDARMKRRWDEMIAAGLKTDADESKNAALRSINDWAHDAGVSLTSLQPDRGDLGKTSEKDFQQITLRASGTGSMRAISRFLWQVQTSPIPMRMTDVQIDSRKPGTDELMVTLAVSTLAQPPAPAAPQAKPPQKEVTR